MQETSGSLSRYADLVRLLVRYGRSDLVTGSGLGELDVTEPPASSGDPATAEAFAAVNVPALIVQGRHDIQVGIDDAEALHRAKPDAELALIDGMNHVLRIVPASAAQLASYDDPDLPLARGLLERIQRFLNDNGMLPASS